MHYVVQELNSAFSYTEHVSSHLYINTTIETVNTHYILLLAKAFKVIQNIWQRDNTRLPFHTMQNTFNELPTTCSQAPKTRVILRLLGLMLY